MDVKDTLALSGEVDGRGERLSEAVTSSGLALLATASWWWCQDPIEVVTARTAAAAARGTTPTLGLDGPTAGRRHTSGRVPPVLADVRAIVGPKAHAWSAMTRPIVWTSCPARRHRRRRRRVRPTTSAGLGRTSSSAASMISPNVVGRESRLRSATSHWTPGLSPARCPMTTVDPDTVKQTPGACSKASSSDSTENWRSTRG